MRGRSWRARRFDFDAPLHHSWRNSNCIVLGIIHLYPDHFHLCRPIPHKADDQLDLSRHEAPPIDIGETTDMSLTLLECNFLCTHQAWCLLWGPALSSCGSESIASDEIRKMSAIPITIDVCRMFVKVPRCKFNEIKSDLELLSIGSSKVLV